MVQKLTFILMIRFVLVRSGVYRAKWSNRDCGIRRAKFDFSAVGWSRMSVLDPLAELSAKYASLLGQLAEFFVVTTVVFLFVRFVVQPLACRGLARWGLAPTIQRTLENSWRGDRSVCCRRRGVGGRIRGISRRTGADRRRADAGGWLPGARRALEYLANRLPAGEVETVAEILSTDEIELTVDVATDVSVSE